MSYSDLLKPRVDVLKEDVEGIIDLTNIHYPKGKKLEADPQRFLTLTYPTADIRRVIPNLSDRFSGHKDAPGLFLFEGLKGSGKSHLLLMIYHLFRNYEAARNWLDFHNIYCQLPKDTMLLVNNFTDLPLYSIWDFIFEKLTNQRPKKSVVQPGLPEVEKIIGDKKLILVLDELEQGIRVIKAMGSSLQLTILLNHFSSSPLFCKLSLLPPSLSTSSFVSSFFSFDYPNS